MGPAMNKFEHENTKVVTLINNEIIAADKTDADVLDTAGFDSCDIITIIGASDDTLSGSNYIEVELEECDTSDGSFTDLADASLSAAAAGATNTGTIIKADAPADASSTTRVGLIGNQQFVQPIVNVTGTHSNGHPITVLAILSNPHTAPVANS